MVLLLMCVRLGSGSSIQLLQSVPQFISASLLGDTVLTIWLVDSEKGQYLAYLRSKVLNEVGQLRASFSCSLLVEF